MGVVPDPHHVSGTWTIPLTMQLAPRSSESWSKIPTAVPSAQFLLNQNMFRADAANSRGRSRSRTPALAGLSRERGAKAGGHPGVDQARGPRRPRLGGERQGQGRDRAGLRVSRHRQPHGPRDARVLGPGANAARKGGGDVISYPHEHMIWTRYTLPAAMEQLREHFRQFMKSGDLLHIPVRIRQSVMLPVN